MKLLGFLCRQRPDHACRAAGCPGKGDAPHLMCPDHRVTGPVRDDTRRWLVDPAHNSRAPMFHHMPRRGWVENWQGQR